MGGCVVKTMVVRDSEGCGETNNKDLSVVGRGRRGSDLRRGLHGSSSRVVHLGLSSNSGLSR